MTTRRPHRDQRYRDRCFPGAEKEVFAPKGGGFAPLPYISRELLRHLKGAELKVWIYLLTRGGPQSICYPTYEEIMRSTGVDTMIAARDVICCAILDSRSSGSLSSTKSPSTISKTQMTSSTSWVCLSLNLSRPLSPCRSKNRRRRLNEH